MELLSRAWGEKTHKKALRGNEQGCLESDTLGGRVDSKEF